MRNLKSIIAVIAISLATTFSTVAEDKKSKKITENLRTEIVTMLGNSIDIELKKTSIAEISFMINNKNELVVISVDSKETDFQSFVKSKLNYKKVAVKGTVKGEIYKVPVKLKAS